MERNIGDKFKYIDVVLEVKEGVGCEECFLYNDYCCENKIRNIIGDCSNKLRSDKAPIVFIKI